MEYSIEYKPYFFTASQPCENAFLNREIDILIFKSGWDYIDMLGYSWGAIGDSEPLYDGDKDVGQTMFYGSGGNVASDLRCESGIKCYIELEVNRYYDKNRTMEIRPCVRILNGYEENPWDEVHKWYFEPEGMKSCDTFFPKGDCMNNYSLKIDIR